MLVSIKGEIHKECNCLEREGEVMSINGSRLYSISEIKAMLNQDMTDDFIRYLCRAPEKIIKILDSWRDTSLESIGQIIGKYQEENTDRQEDYKDAISANDNVLCEPLYGTLDENAKQEDDHIIVEKNPYLSMDFSDRINVDKIYAYIVDTLACKNDSHKIRKIQIVAKKNNGGLFGVMMDCCDECKKLYVLRESVLEKVDLFEKKQIKFEFKEIE